ncbi:MAG: phage capsid protein [Pirellulales bacterium]
MRVLFSVDIPVAYVTQFSTNVHLLAEQRYSRLIGTVMREDVTGESWSVEITGGTSVNKINERHGDTPLNNTPQTRRWGFISDYDVADLIDKQDRVKMLIQLDSIYTMRHAGAMGRALDDEIIDALYRTAVTGHTGSGTTAYDTTNQQLASGSVGLTIDKLNRAKEILDHNEVDDFYQRYFILGSRQIRELLEDDKITSADFNTVKALVEGKVDTFLGFKFIRTERLQLPSASTRNCFAYAQPAIRFGMAMAPNTVSSVRPDKRYAAQIYSCGSWGALRTEDQMVVSVLCSEA